MAMMAPASTHSLRNPETRAAPIRTQIMKSPNCSKKILSGPRGFCLGQLVGPVFLEPDRDLGGREPRRRVRAQRRGRMLDVGVPPVFHFWHSIIHEARPISDIIPAMSGVRPLLAPGGFHPEVAAEFPSRAASNRPSSTGSRRLCREFRPFPSARAVLVRRTLRTRSSADSSEAMGASRARGSIWPSSAIGEIRTPPEASVTRAKALILEATLLGLGTCWVSGFFRPEAVRRALALGPAESVYAVSPLGVRGAVPTAKDRIYSALAGSRSEKPLSRIVSGTAADPLAGEGGRSGPARPFGDEPPAVALRPGAGSDHGRLAESGATAAAIRSGSTAGSPCSISSSAPSPRDAPGRGSSSRPPGVARFEPRSDIRLKVGAISAYNPNFSSRGVAQPG